MSTFQTANNNSKFKKYKAGSGTDDNSRTELRTFDFSNGKMVINFTHFVTIILFVGAAVWFFSTKWYYDTAIQKIKNELEIKINKIETQVNNKASN